MFPAGAGVAPFGTQQQVIGVATPAMGRPAAPSNARRSARARCAATASMLSVTPSPQSNASTIDFTRTAAGKAAAFQSLSGAVALKCIIESV